MTIFSYMKALSGQNENVNPLMSNSHHIHPLKAFSILLKLIFSLCLIRYSYTESVAVTVASIAAIIFVYLYQRWRVRGCQEAGNGEGVIDEKVSTNGIHKKKLFLRMVVTFFLLENDILFCFPVIKNPGYRL